MFKANPLHTNFIKQETPFRPVKVAFHFKKIATEFLLPQCISVRSLECYPKNPPKSQLRNQPNLHKFKMAANMADLCIQMIYLVILSRFIYYFYMSMHLKSIAKLITK